MTKQHVHPLELGAVWYVIPLLWLCVALVGWTLISEQPALFAGPLPAHHVALSGPAAAAVPYESSDPSLPPASRVFTGSSQQASPDSETF